jgi:hypothetical protein
LRDLGKRCVAGVTAFGLCDNLVPHAVGQMSKAHFRGLVGEGFVAYAFSFYFALPILTLNQSTTHVLNVGFWYERGGAATHPNQPTVWGFATAGDAGPVRPVRRFAVK